MRLTAPWKFDDTTEEWTMASRYDQIVKFINKALKEDHLYSNEEIAFMKSQLRQLRETKDRLRKEERGGFGS